MLLVVGDIANYLNIGFLSRNGALGEALGVGKYATYQIVRLSESAWVSEGQSVLIEILAKATVDLQDFRVMSVAGSAARPVFTIGFEPTLCAVLRAVFDARALP